MNPFLNMLLTSIIKSILLIIYKIMIFSEIMKKIFIKDMYIKEFCLFIIFYIFLNLYLLPTIALCEIDLNLLDRENNTYKGSKIAYETENDIVTVKEMEKAKKTCYAVAEICGLSFAVLFPLFIYLWLDYNGY